jgi:hypothetical protein
VGHRERPHTDRIACPWLIRKFIDPDAEIVYMARDQVLDYAARDGATSFDAPGATYTRRDGYDALYAWAQREVASAADTSSTRSRR